MNHYNFYKKLHKTQGLTQNITIENPHFIDRLEITEHFAKSTPIALFDKESKLLPKNLITFEYQKNSDLNDTRFEQSDRSIIFEGYLAPNQSLKIDYNLYHHNKLNSHIKDYFTLLFVFSLIVAGILLYALFIIKQTSIREEKMKKKFTQKEKEIEKIAFEDSLTGAASRLKFNATLNDIINTSFRFKGTFSLVMFDVDHFKSFNDIYGHDAGDLVLKELSKCVKQNLREADTFARWGGEEFMIILPQANLQQAVLVTTKIQHAIRQLKIQGLPKITCSFGVVSYQENDDHDSIIKRVDEKLYLAKEKGRDRIEF